MQVTETKSEGLKREFKVVIPAGDIEQRVKNRLEHLAHSVRLPGFRAGKVPLGLVDKKYRPSVLGEVLQQSVSEGSQRTLTDRGLRPATQPKVEITSFADGKDLEFDVAVELFPAVPTIDFRAIALTRLVAEPDETEIQGALDRLSKAHGTTEPIAEVRETRTGDVLLIDFAGTADGANIPGGKAEGYLLELGSGSLIPGFEDNLIGRKAGEKVTFDIRFPEDYGAAQLAGKMATFAVDVREIRAPQPAALDDALAKKAGAEDLEGLRKAIRDEHNRQLRSVSRVLLKRALLDELAGRYHFPVPPAMHEQEFQAIWKQFDEQRKAADGKVEGEYTGKTDEEIQADLRTIAERRVRLGLLLAEVGRLNNIAVSQEDLNRAIGAEARRYPGREKQVVDFYRNTSGALDSLRAPLYEDKVVDFVVELAQVTEKPVPLAELMREAGAQGSEAPAA